MFEEALAAELKNRVNNMYGALATITRGDPENLNKFDVSELLFQRLDKFVKDTGELEGNFWDAVTPFEITEFRNEQGELLDLPNTVEIFRTPKADGGLLFPSQTGRAVFLAAAPKGLSKDLKEIFEYFGQSFDEVFPEAAAEIGEETSSRLSKALERFNTLQDELRGTDNFNSLQRAIEQVNQMETLDEKIT